MEDYIFLIIAIGLSIFAALRKKKQKENTGPPGKAAPQKPHNDFMDQLWDGEFFPDDEDEETIWTEKEKVVPKKEPVMMVPRPLVREEYHSKMKSHLPERRLRNFQTSVKKVIESEEEEVTEVSDEPGLMEDFSMKKAVVYSEIMNRKYE